MKGIIIRKLSFVALLQLLLCCWNGQGFLYDGHHTRAARPIQQAPVLLPRYRPSVFSPFQLLASSSDIDSSSSSSSDENDNDRNNNNNKASKDMLTIFVQSLWKGMTLPFPALRRIVVQPSYRNQNRKMAIGLSFREGLLALFSYLGLGVLAYSVVLEKWSIIDALYFSCVVRTYYKLACFHENKINHRLARDNACY